MRDFSDSEDASAPVAINGKTSERSGSASARQILSAGEVYIGTLVSFGVSGDLQVKCEELYGDSLKTAIATVSVEPRALGRQVALMFVNGDSNQPIIVGFIRSQLTQILDAFSVSDAVSETRADLGDQDVFENVHVQPSDKSTLKQVDVDGRKLTIEAKDEISLKCGDASITLTKDGKISIRGKYILNRSSGVNRVLGGSVEIN